MKTQTILVVFIVLLFLLTLLGSFGGAIRPREPFYDETPVYQPSEMTSMQAPSSRSAGQPTLASGYMEPTRTATLAPTASIPTPPPITPDTPKNNANPTIQAPQEEENLTERFQVVEKFEVPEAFEDFDAQLGAPF